MKSVERLVKDHITSILPLALDPLQFPYHPNHSSEDAISPALHLSFEHLEEKNTHVRILFFNFSSAFKYHNPPASGRCTLPTSTKLSTVKLDFRFSHRKASICAGRQQYIIYHLTEHPISAGMCLVYISCSSLRGLTSLQPSSSLSVGVP